MSKNMKKILNEPTEFVPEMLDGLLKAHPDQLDFAGDDIHCIVRADAPVAGKVALATGGGSGHLPDARSNPAHPCRQGGGLYLWQLRRRCYEF